MVHTVEVSRKIVSSVLLAADADEPVLDRIVCGRFTVNYEFHDVLLTYGLEVGVAERESESESGGGGGSVDECVGGYHAEEFDGEGVDRDERRFEATLRYIYSTVVTCHLRTERRECRLA